MSENDLKLNVVKTQTSNQTGAMMPDFYEALTPDEFKSFIESEYERCVSDFGYFCKHYVITRRTEVID